MWLKFGGHNIGLCQDANYTETFDAPLYPTRSYTTGHYPTAGHPTHFILLRIVLHPGSTLSN